MLGKQGTSFLIFFVSARFLSPYEFGVYSYLISFLFFLAFFGDFGISMAVVKFISERKSQGGNKDEIGKIIFNSFLIILLASLLVLLFSLGFGRFFLRENFWNFLYLLPLFFLVPFVSVCDGIFRAQGRFKTLAIILTISGFTSFFLSYFLIRYFGIKGALLSQNFLYFFQFLFLLGSLGKVFLKIDLSLIRKILKYSLTIGFSSVGYLLFSRLNTIVLGKFGYVIEAGYYEMVSKIINQMLVFPYAIAASVVAPMTGRIFYGIEGQRRIIKKIKKWGVVVFLSAFLVSFIFYIFFPLLFKWVFPKYQNETIYFMARISIFIFPIWILSYFYGNGFSVSTGYARLNLKTNLIFGIINLILTLIVLPLWGFKYFFVVTSLISIFSSIYFIIDYFNLLGVLRTNK